MASQQTLSEDEDEEVPLAVPLQSDTTPFTSRTETNAASPAHDIDAVRSITPPLPPVPVLLLTGYLGAGKTTLVNYILTAKHGYRCAVLLNEIADSADVEKALVREPEGGSVAAPLAEWVQLENGCICCSVKSDMVQALEALMMQRERFDYVIIETTGLANPGPVAAALWTDAAIESSVCLDAIVTVVDAKNILRHLREVRPAGAVNEAQQQVAFADVVLLNKTDLVNQNTLREVEGEIAAINAEAPVLHCERCEIDLGRILDTGLYAGNAATRGDHVEEQQSGNCAVADMEHGEDSIIGDHNNGSAGDDRPMNTGSTTHHHHHQHHQQQHQHHSDHAHDDGSVECGSACCSDSQPTADHHRHGVRSVTFYVDKPIRLSRLRHWLDELLWEQERLGTEYQQTNSHSVAQRNGNGVVDPGKLDLREAFVEEIGPIEIFRIKGLLHVHNSTSQWVLQAVHELYDIVQGREWPKGDGSTYRSKLVFIGRRLNEDMLRKGIEACC